MKMLVAALAAAVTVALVGAAPAQAQIAAALGKPLPSSDLADGTISVRVINGDPSQPAIGADVTLTVGGATRTARTDSQGRAIFQGVGGGATAVASVRGSEGEIKSEAFPTPVTGGVRMLLSTKALGAGANDTGAAEGGGPGGPGGPGGMPEPRNMSGQPRVEPKDPSGVVTVRLSYNDFAGAAPVGHTVYLVGYAADGSIRTRSGKSDAGGRVQFPGLDVSGATSYFAMTVLPRGNDVDRLISAPMMPDGNGGIRLILSAAKKDATEPPIDDIKNFSEQTPMPAGRVHVELDYAAQTGAPVRLLNAVDSKVVAQVTSGSPSPEPGTVKAALDAVAEDAALPAGSLVLTINRTGDRGVQPLGEGVVLVRPVGATAGREVPVAGGTATVDGLPVGKPLEVVLTVAGVAAAPVPLTLPAGKAGRTTLTATWASRPGSEARFDGVAADGVYLVETEMHGQVYRSFPFQAVASRGTVASIAVVPRLLLKFSLNAAAEDTYFAVQGRYEVQNWAWAPYREGPDGMVVEMPAGFTGAVVFDPKDAVTADPKGFRILRPLPPGGMRFHAGFSLHVKDGTVTWNMPLPLGAYDSGIQMRQLEGMQVDVPAGNGKVMNDDDGTPYFVVPNISIRPRESMIMTVRGLPTVSAWSVWAPRVIGIAVLLIVFGGLGYAFAGARRATPGAGEAPQASRARIDALYDQLVALDKDGRDGGDAGKRAAILAELEQLLAERAAARASARD